MYDVIKIFCKINRCCDQKAKMDSKIKALERRCPRLGGQVEFRYCLSAENDHRPCFKIMDCWWERFDVYHYLEAALPVEHFKALLQAEPPKPKACSLVELIEAARQRTKTV